MRETNKNNILAIEFKHFNNNKKKDIQTDRLKLKALTDNSGMYKYKIGLFIKFGKSLESIIIERYIDGKKSKEDSI